MTNVRELSNLVRALLVAQAPNILTFETPNYTTPTHTQWWVYYSNAGHRYNTRTGGIATDLRWGFTLICVGRTREACENVADKADALFIGRRLDGNDYTSVLTQVDNGDQVKPEADDPMGARFSVNKQYQLNTRS